MAQQNRAMRTILTALAFLTLPAPGTTKVAEFYVAQAIGSDANACSTPSQPCLTIQGAYNKCPRYGVCSIQVADGIYPGQVNTYYHHVVNIRGNCADPSRVVMQLDQPHRPLFWAQDDIIAIIGCLTMLSDTTGGAAIQSRQYGIVDYYNIRFGPFPNGVHISLAEKTKANCGGNVEIYGDAVVHVATGDQSFLYGACTMTFTGQRTFTDVFQCIGLSLCRFNDVIFAGTPPAGRIVYNDQSRVKGADKLPSGTTTTVNGGFTGP